MIWTFIFLKITKKKKKSSLEKITKKIYCNLFIFSSNIDILNISNYLRNIVYDTIIYVSDVLRMIVIVLFIYAWKMDGV